MAALCAQLGVAAASPVANVSVMAAKPSLMQRFRSNQARLRAQDEIAAFARAGGKQIEAAHQDALHGSGATQLRLIKRVASSVYWSASIAGGLHPAAAPLMLPLVVTTGRIALDARKDQILAEHTANTKLLERAKQLGHTPSDAQLARWRAAQIIDRE